METHDHPTPHLQPTLPLIGASALAFVWLAYTITFFALFLPALSG